MVEQAQYRGRMARALSVQRCVAILVGSVVLAAGCGTGQTESGSGTSPLASPVPVNEAGCRAEPIGPTTYRYVDRAGVNPALTSLDVYLPAGCDPVPVVVWVHGGGWRAGSKSSESTRTKAAWANQQGLALVALNYRLSTPGAGVVWPDHSDDVAAGLSWIGREGPALGLDPSSVVLIGHSAGAHLVTLAVTNAELVEAAGLGGGLRCVVALDSASFDLATSRANSTGLVANAFGSDPKVIAEASPLVQVVAGGPVTVPLLVVTRGPAVWMAAAETFVDAVNTAGGSATLVEANPYSHGEVNNQLGAEGEELVTTPVTRFVTDCLNLPR